MQVAFLCLKFDMQVPAPVYYLPVTIHCYNKVFSFSTTASTSSLVL